jgi:putative endopeptidase
MQIRVGYPRHFDEYRDLPIIGDGLYEDFHRAAAYHWHEQVRHLSAPFNRSRWALPPMYPQYSYDPPTNTANVSAALLQPPFLDPDADPAVNYGAIGTVIAQQMVTAFGPNSIRFDGSGRLVNWLRPEESQRLASMAATLAERYSALEPIPGSHPRGQVLASEAMADIGAIQIALDAYHLSLHGRETPRLDNLTGDQRFFLGRAQSWRARFTDDAIRNQLAQGGNAVPWMGINGPLPNVDAWYEAFEVRPGQRLYLPPSERLHPL